MMQQRYHGVTMSTSHTSLIPLSSLVITVGIDWTIGIDELSQTAKMWFVWCFNIHLQNRQTILCIRNGASSFIFHSMQLYSRNTLAVNRIVDMCLYTVYGKYYSNHMLVALYVSVSTNDVLIEFCLYGVLDEAALFSDPVNASVMMELVYFIMCHSSNDHFVFSI